MTNTVFYVGWAVGIAFLLVAYYLAWRDSKKPSDHYHYWGNGMSGTFGLIAAGILIIMFFSSLPR